MKWKIGDRIEWVAWPFYKKVIRKGKVKDIYTKNLVSVEPLLYQYLIAPDDSIDDLLFEEFQMRHSRPINDYNDILKGML